MKFKKPMCSKSYIFILFYIAETTSKSPLESNILSLQNQPCAWATNFILLSVIHTCFCIYTPVIFRSKSNLDERCHNFTLKMIKQYHLEKRILDDWVPLWLAKTSSFDIMTLWYSYDSLLCWHLRRSRFMLPYPRWRALVTI